MPETTAGRGRPRPRRPPRDAASSREARPPAGVSGGADLPGLQRPGGGPVPALLRAGGKSGPYLSLGTGCGCGGAAGEGPERGSSAGNPPGRRARSKGRGARRAGSVPGAGQAGRAGLSGSGRQRPTSPSRRYPHRAAAETAGTGPREEPQPERRLRRRSRGGATGAATRSPGSSCGLSGAPRHEGDTRRAECPRLSRGELRVARGAGLLPPGSATASCWGCAGGSAAGRDRQWGGGPGRPRGGSSGPARRLPSPSVPRTEARNVN